MRISLLAAATAAALSLGTLTAEAAPLVVVAPAVAPPIVRVAAGCGLGFHRGLLGRCVGNGVVVGRVLPRYRGVYAHRWTALGWHRAYR